MATILEQSCRERLKTAVSAALQASDQLEKLIAPDGSRHDRQGNHFSPRSRPPWNPEAAYLITELHQEARSAERRLRLFLSLPVRPRGSSQANTQKALEAVLSLAEAAGDTQASDEARWLERWHARAKRALGEASPVARLPRQPGEPERACPFCTFFTLRYWSLDGVVRCVNPSCRDEDGRRPSAKIEYSNFTHQLELVWMDGVCGLPELPGC